MRRSHSIISICILAVCVGLPAMTWAQTPSRGSSEYLDGLSALASGNMSDALAGFNKAVAADDENSAYHTAKGIALYLSDKSDLAIDEFERSQKLGKTSATDLWGWANAMVLLQPPRDDLDPNERARQAQQRRRVNFDTRPPFESKEPYTRPFIDTATKYNMSIGRDPAQTQQLKKEIFQFAAAYAWNEMSGPKLAPFLMSRVKTLYEQQKFPECLVLIDRIRANNANDPNLLFYSAGCKASAGDNESARAEYTLVLKQWTQHAPSFLGRARAAAHMGAMERANVDLAIATSIDAKAAEPLKAVIAKELSDGAAKVPKQSQTELLAALKKAVADNVPMKTLVDQSEQLERAAAAVRFIPAEGYTDERQKREAAAAADPKNADKQAALAEFLVNPTVQRPVRIPGKTGTTRIPVGDADVSRAMPAINAALAINPKHINALTQGALAAVANKQANDAIQWVQRAFDAGGSNLDLCKTWLDYYTNQANQLSAEASSLRTPKSHTEFRGGSEYLVTVYPSPAELARAADLDRQADELRRKAATPLQKLIELKKGAIEGHLASAEFERWRGKWDASIAAANDALKMDPWNLDAHEFLVDLCPKVGMMDVAIEHQDILNNLVNASAGRTLDKVWKLLADTKYRSAREMIDSAEKIDPASARVAAYRMTVAIADKNTDEINRFARQSLAMEQGRERVNGRSLDPTVQTQLTPDDAGLTMSIGNLYGGALQNQSMFNEATDVYRLVIVLGKRLPANLWDAAMQSSALPTVENQQDRGWTPRQLMTDASHQASIAFLAAGKAEDSAKALMAWIQLYGRNDLPQGAMDFGYEIYQKLGPQKSAQYFTQNMMGYYQMKDGQAENKRILQRGDDIQKKYEQKMEDIRRRQADLDQQIAAAQRARNTQQVRALAQQRQQLQSEYNRAIQEMNQEQMRNIDPNNGQQNQQGYQQPNYQQPNYPQQNNPRQQPPRLPSADEFGQ